MRAVTVAETFVDIWNPADVPHIEISGPSGSGTRAAAQKIATHAITTWGAEVRLIVGHPGTAALFESPVVAWHPEDALELIESMLRDLNRRLAQLEEEQHTGEQPPAVHPIVLVVDEYSTLIQRPSPNPTVRTRIREYLGDILALGRNVGIHVIVTGAAPSFAHIGQRDGIGQVVLGPMSSVPVAQLSAGLYQVAELPIRPIGSGWYFRTGDHRPQPVGF